MSNSIHGDRKEFRVPDGKGGGKSIFIRKSVLDRVKSRIKTHEGEILNGREGRNYMDKHSKEKLGKDMSGMYKRDL